MEIWKDVVGYEDRYQISSLGRIKSKTRKTKFGRGWRVYEEQIIKPAEDKDGYLKVGLSKDGKKSRFFVHRIIATSFIKNPSELPVVNHIDGDKQNNQIENLEWVTHSENVLHAFKTGLKKPHNGGTNKPVNKIDIETGEVIDSYDSVLEASKSVGATAPLIGMACNDKIKTAKGFVWRFK